VTGQELGEEDELHLALKVDEETGALSGDAFVSGKNRNDDLRFPQPNIAAADLAGFHFEVSANIEVIRLYGAAAAMPRPPVKTTSTTTDTCESGEDCNKVTTTPETTRSRRLSDTKVSASMLMSHGDDGVVSNVVKTIGENQVLTAFTADKKATMVCNLNLDDDEE
jgi:hypothetical protein